MGHPGPANFLFPSALSLGHSVGMEQLVNRLDPAFIPYFLKPAPHQLNVCVG